jgi:hypothetical protein
MWPFHPGAVIVVALAGGLLGACARTSGVASTEARAASSTAGRAAESPVQAPRPGILGCVESRELKEYVLSLDAHRQQARRAALAAFGATRDERRGVFGSSGAASLDQSYEAGGQRFAVAAELASHFEPRVSLARQGSVLHRIDERPRAHAVDVLACGLERCTPPVSGPRVAARPVVIELASGESWGGALRVTYDYWWARVRYDQRETCPSRE